MRLDRAYLFRALAAFSSLPALPPPSSAARKGGPQPWLRPSIRLPLLQCGSAFCTEYRIDGQRFRGVVDTGSPFLLALSERTCVGGPERWGCYSEASGGLLEESWEGFGGQDVHVQWRRGSLRLSAVGDNAAALADRRAGGRTGPWTTPNDATDVIIEPINFGVVDDYRGSGGAGAISLGLAKDRSSGTRPTLLEQTDVAALRFDFHDLTLTLSRRPLIGSGGDFIPLVDLRAYGAPVSPYTVLVHRLIVNGEPVALGRPTLAVLDTGTTGLVISDTLYDTDELPLPGAAIRSVAVDVISRRGQISQLSASTRPPRPRGHPRPGGVAESSLPPFPFIVTPVHLPWFDERRGRRHAGASRSSSTTTSDVDAARSPHVLFLGLAFLAETRLTIDVDAERMTVGPART
jgi:hypothetical protein